MTDLCKRTYLRIADKEAEKRLNELLEFCDKNKFGHVSQSERWEGEKHFVQVIIDIKISAGNAERKDIYHKNKIQSIEPIKK